MTMQIQTTLLGSPMSHLAGGSRLTQMTLSSGSVFRMSNKVGLRVKCMAEEGIDGEPKVAPSSPSSSTPSPSMKSSTPNPTPTPSPKKPSTSFTDIFAFSGPAPERINGRLAMIGFVAAIAMEISKGSDLFSQISDGGAQWFLGTSILLSVASLVPLFRGERAEAKTQGVMNSNAELWNGRLAMLGLVALAFTEYVKGGALI